MHKQEDAACARVRFFLNINGESTKTVVAMITVLDIRNCVYKRDFKE